MKIVLKPFTYSDNHFPPPCVFINQKGKHFDISIEIPDMSEVCYREVSPHIFSYLEYENKDTCLMLKTTYRTNITIPIIISYNKRQKQLCIFKENHILESISEIEIQGHFKENLLDIVDKLNAKEVFLTNTSMPLPSDIMEKLNRKGVEVNNLINHS